MRRYPVQLRWWNRAACPAPVPIGSLPSGFVAAFGVSTVASPVPPAQNPANGVFLAGAVLPPGLVGARDEGEYLAADLPDGRIGVLAIGVSPIGWRRPNHGIVFEALVAGEGEFELPPMLDPALDGLLVLDWSVLE